MRVELQTIARLSALQHLHEAASSTKKTGATNSTAGKKTSSRSKKNEEKQASDDSKGSRKADASTLKPDFKPYESLETDCPAMKASFAKYRAALQEEQAQAASKEATKQKPATKKKEGSPIWQDSDSAECEPTGLAAWYALMSAESEAKHSDSDDCSDGSTD